MKNPLARPILAAAAASIVTAALGLAWAAAPEPVAPEDSPLAHMVYFTLKDDSEAHRQKLVDACEKYLSGHDGTLGFAAGPIAGELDREVNDRDFDVALLIIFETRAAQDKYQEAPRHLKFIEENSATWAKVRVFDSYLTAMSHARGESKPGGR